MVRLVEYEELGKNVCLLFQPYGKPMQERTSLPKIRRKSPYLTPRPNDTPFPLLTGLTSPSSSISLSPMSRRSSPLLFDKSIYDLPRRPSFSSISSNDLQEPSSVLFEGSVTQCS